MLEPGRIRVKLTSTENMQLQVIEGTFEPKGPVIPLRTNSLPFTTNIVVRNSVGGGGRKPIIKTRTRPNQDAVKGKTSLPTSFRPGEGK